MPLEDKPADTGTIIDVGPTPAITPAVAKPVADAGKDGVKPVAAVDAKPVASKPSSLLADGPDEEDDAPPKTTTWAENWRELMAGKDAKELSRYADPAGVWKKVKNLEKKLNEKVAGPVKPGDDATPEDKAAYYKALGVPEKPEAYFDQIKLPNNAVLGEADKPLVESFAKAMHPHGMTPDAMSGAVAWLKDHERQVAENQVVADESFRVTARDALRDEWGNDFKRNHQAATATFKDMPAEISNAILMARTADGRLVGNIPELVKWAAQVEFERNPSSSVVPSRGTDPGKSVDDRINEIRTLRKNKPDEYRANQKAFDAEEIELIDAQLRQKNRGQKAA